MNKKLLTICFMSSIIVSTQLCALRSITDLFNDSEIMNIVGFGVEEEDMQLIKSLYTNMEDAYNKINAKLGDETTRNLEELINETIKNFNHTAAQGTICSTCLEDLITYLQDMLSHIQKKKGVTKKEIAQFILATLSIRIIVAGAEFAAEDPEGQKAMFEGKDKKAIERKKNLMESSKVLDEYIGSFIEKHFSEIIKSATIENPIAT